MDPNNTVGSIRTDGEVFFADDIDMTAQTDIFFDETVDVGVGTTTVTSTVGNVTFDGAVNATTDDTAADLTVSAAQGTVAFNSTVGATRQGNDLSVSAGQIRLGGSITTQDAAGADDGDVTLSADSGIVLDANVTITSFGAADEDSGEVLLRGPVNGDNSGTVRDLVITTDATTDSTITIEDPVGANIGLDKVSFDAGRFDRNRRRHHGGGCGLPGSDRRNHPQRRHRDNHERDRLRQQRFSHHQFPVMSPCRRRPARSTRTNAGNDISGRQRRERQFDHYVNLGSDQPRPSGCDCPAVVLPWQAREQPP